MKRIVCIVACVLLIIAMVGCSGENINVNGASDENIAGTACNHSYSAATCMEPSKCEKCGDTRGSLGAHSYEEGVCTFCDAEDPDWQPPVLTGSEYERINSLMEGMYQFRNSTGTLVEYNFEDGSFVCYAQLGNSILENSGTYILTEKTLILYYQNGTVKNCRWKLNDNGEIELFLLDLE